jgi:hypothetical protein
MSTAATAVGRRIDTSPTTLAVAVGDAAAIGLFVVAGEYSHGFDPTVYPLRALDTFAPFFIGWLVVSLLGGLYTADAWRSPKRVVAWTVPAWIGAAAIAQLLRATPLFHGGAALTFFLVSAAVGATLLVGWRTVVSYVD